MLFLKGYQWPFDSKKVMHGSSVIDLLVYRERVLKKRSVYLDYRKNPFGLSELMFERCSRKHMNIFAKREPALAVPSNDWSG